METTLEKKLDYVQMLQIFQEKFDGLQNETPTLIPEDQWKLRAKLMQEELDEYKDACIDRDLVEVLDANIDMLFLAFGNLVKHGMHNIAFKAFKEVFLSNMSKLGTDGKAIINGANCELDPTRPYGKVLKGPNFFEPDLKQFIAERPQK